MRPLTAPSGWILLVAALAMLASAGCPRTRFPAAASDGAVSPSADAATRGAVVSSAGAASSVSSSSPGAASSASTVMATSHSAPSSSWSAAASSRSSSAPGVTSTASSAPGVTSTASSVPGVTSTASSVPGAAPSSSSGDALASCTELHGVVTRVAPGTYCVSGDVIIPAGAVLTIPPGTSFVFMGRFHFGRDPALPDDANAISGGLVAVGTPEQPIVFRGENPQTGWFGITISHSPVPVHLEYVTIRDAYKDDHNPTSRIWRRGGGLSSYVNGAGTIIRHCQFINNRAWMVAGALDVNTNWDGHQTQPVEVTDTLFDSNTCECGIYVGSADDKCGGGAIRFSHVAGPVTVERNTFRHNQALNTNGIPAYGGALGAFDSAVPLGAGNTFEHNVASEMDGAISCAGHPALGINFIRVDPGNTFTGNLPDVGCGL